MARRARGVIGRWFGPLLAGIVGVGAAGCGRKAEPVGRLIIAPAVISLGYPQTVALRLQWQPTAPLEKRRGNPIVFVHLLERPGKVLRTFDHSFPGEWKPGRRVDYEIDIYQSALGEGLPAGRYLLTVGLYDDSVGYRWPLQADGPDVGKREYQLGTIDVPESVASPRFEFVGGWLPLAAGTDRQILGRRGIRGAASIRVSDMNSPGTVRLALAAPGMSVPAVEVTSDCGEHRRETPETEPAWIGFTLSAAGSGPCEIQFAQNRPEGTPQQAHVSLEVLSWRPAS